MADQKPAAFSLNGGEIDQETAARVDIDGYTNKAAVYENALPAVKGAMRRAPGTKLLSRLPGDAFGILRRWRYSRDQQFQMLMQEGVTRIIDGEGFIQTGPGSPTVGAWSDLSSGAATATAASPTWPDGPFLSDFGGAAHPVTIVVPDGGTGKARLSCTGVTAADAHSMAIVVERHWLDLRIGTTAGGSEITKAEFGLKDLRLDPGYYVLTFTPGATTFYVEVKANEPGKRSVTSLSFLGAHDLQLPTPYLEEDLRILRFEQAGDVKWVWHRDYAWRAIERFANQSWALVPWAPEDGPFLGLNTGPISLTPSSLKGVAGEVTLTADEPLWESDHIGQLVQLIHKGQNTEQVVTTDDVWTNPIRVSGTDASRYFTIWVSDSTETWAATVTLQRSVGNDVDWQDVTTYAAWTYQANFDDTFDNQIIYYRLGVKAGEFTSGSLTLKLDYINGETVGVARIVSITSETVAVADVLSPFGAVTATGEWAHGAWGPLYGWPAVGALHSGRLFLSRDRNLWGSESDGFTDYTVGVDDDSAMSRIIAVGDAAPTEWMVAARRLLLGTSTNELAVRSTVLDDPITPTNMGVDEQTARGSPEEIDGQKLDTRILMVEASRQRLLQLSYDSDAQGYVPRDLTRLHERIAGPDPGFQGLALQRSPEPRAWLPRADGQVAILTFAEDENVVGWARRKAAPTAAGPSVYEEVSISHSAPEDLVYLISKRTIDGDERRYLELVMPEVWTRATGEDGPTEDEIAACWRVEMGVAYVGAPATTFTGFGEWEGETLVVWANGSDHPPVTVESGQVTLNTETTVAIFGLESQARWQSARIPGQGEKGVPITAVKQMNTVDLILHQTARGTVQVGRSFATLTDLPDREYEFMMDEGPGVYTGAVIADTPGRNERDPRLCIVFRGAGPASVLGYVPNLNVNES